MQWVRGYIAATVLFVVYGAGKSHAALPPSAVQDDTVLLVHVDLRKIDAAATRNSVRSLLGPAGPGLDPILGIFQVGYESLISSGLATITVSWSPPKSESDDPYYAVYLQLRSGADPAVIEKLAREYWPDKGDAPAFERSAGCVVAHLHDQPVRPPGLRARAKTFAESFAAARDRAVVIAFSPNAHVRELAPAVPTAGLPERVASLVPIVLQSDWTTIGIKLGASPSVTAIIRAKDTASADALMKLLHPGSASQPADPVSIISSLIRPVRNGSRVSFELSGPSLSRVIASVSDTVPTRQAK